MTDVTSVISVPDYVPQEWDRRRVIRPAACLIVREALSRSIGLLPVCETAAHVLREHLDAAAVRISLLDVDHYLDIVNAGVRAPDQTTHPGHGWYPRSHYPTASKAVLAGESYRRSDPADPVVSEYQHIWGQYLV
ncbi:MAG TPA: hypothetical protein VMT88_11840, partial [Actinomycetes bacterium]|nr:hypothetical protein [Actinomycetes bacterium]